MLSYELHKLLLLSLALMYKKMVYCNNLFIYFKNIQRHSLKYMFENLKMDIYFVTIPHLVIANV